jgi:hypothetical protein
MAPIQALKMMIKRRAGAMGLRETIGRQRCHSVHVAPVSLRQSHRTGS